MFRANGLTERWGRDVSRAFRARVLQQLQTVPSRNHRRDRRPRHQHARGNPRRSHSVFFWCAKGVITTGALVASMILVWRILSPFQSLCMMVLRLEQIKNSIIQVNNLMDLEGESALSNGSGSLRQIKGHLSFQRVGFSLHDGPGTPFISDPCIRCQGPGELVMISGSNGTGKSSILKLARGLYTPAEWRCPSGTASIFASSTPARCAVGSPMFRNALTCLPARLPTICGSSRRRRLTAISGRAP